MATSHSDEHHSEREADEARLRRRTDGELEVRLRDISKGIPLAAEAAAAAGSQWCWGTVLALRLSSPKSLLLSKNVCRYTQRPVPLGAERGM